MLEIMRTGLSRSINAACSGMLVQGGFIPRFCRNKFLACLSYISLLLKRIIMETQGRFLWRKYHALSTELKSLTCINSKVVVDLVSTHLD